MPGGLAASVITLLRLYPRCCVSLTSRWAISLRTSLSSVRFSYACAYPIGASASAARPATAMPCCTLCSELVG
eukprot:764514-Hanusia_phi.AAC.2